MSVPRSGDVVHTFLFGTGILLGLRNYWTLAMVDVRHTPSLDADSESELASFQLVALYVRAF